jgi:hypothetical protein
MAAACYLLEVLGLKVSCDIENPTALEQPVEHALRTLDVSISQVCALEPKIKWSCRQEKEKDWLQETLSCAHDLLLRVDDRAINEKGTFKLGKRWQREGSNHTACIQNSYAHGNPKGPSLLQRALIHQPHAA